MSDTNKLKEMLNDIVSFYFEMHKLGYETLSFIFVGGLLVIWVVFKEFLGLQSFAYTLGTIWILVMLFPMSKSLKKKKEEVQERESEL